MVVKDCQRAPQAYPLLVASKHKFSELGSGVATILLHLKSTHAFQQKFSSRLE
jgi:hypothetical protein